MNAFASKNLDRGISAAHSPRLRLFPGDNASSLIYDFDNKAVFKNHFIAQLFFLTYCSFILEVDRRLYVQIICSVLIIIVSTIEIVEGTFVTRL